MPGEAGIFSELYFPWLALKPFVPFGYEPDKVPDEAKHGKARQGHLWQSTQHPRDLQLGY